MTETDVSTHIPYFRHLCRLGQEQLVLQEGLNTAFLGHLERSLKSPTVRALEKIAKPLNITLGKFFSEDLSASFSNGAKREEEG